ncbi:MAG: ABC transporter substrate-binding protein [Veillonellaceae bacterium]|nr:ABC transporter substrate-binding protein [Veillonellaceae bacterium]
MGRTCRILGLVALVLVLLTWYFTAGRTPAPSPPGTVTITDGLGREVSIRTPTEKIISLTNADTETLLALGVTPYAVVSNFNMSPEIAQRLAGVPEAGAVTAPNLEKIVALKPDLVAGGLMPFQTQLASPLTQAGIPAVFLLANSYRDILERITFWGNVTGRNREATELVRTIERDVAAVREKYAHRERKRILIVWGTATSFQLASSHTFVGDLVAQVPVENLADSFAGSMEKKGLGTGFVALDPEYLAKADPDVVLVVTHGVSQEKAKTFLAAFQKQSVWQKLRAVREGHVHILPQEMFASNPNVRVAQSVAYVGQVLYEQ